MMVVLVAEFEHTVVGFDVMGQVGKKVGSPKFKRKSGNQSAEFTRAAFSRNGESIYLAKIGDINPIWSRELPSEPSSITVIKDCAN
jgi:putative transposase